jgi:hypothetical protein
VSIPLYLVLPNEIILSALYYTVFDKSNTASVMLREMKILRYFSSNPVVCNELKEKLKLYYKSL